MDQIRNASPLAGIARPFAVAAAIGLVLALGAQAAYASPARPASRPAPSGPLAKVPPYYVALRVLTPGGDRPGQTYAPRTDAVIRRTATGATIATIAVPKPYFTFVSISGAAGDRTFVLAAQRRATLPLSVSDVPPTRFFLLRIRPSAARASQRARLSALPIPNQPRGIQLIGIAVSPNGGRLAVTSRNWRGQDTAPALHVFSMATGAERSWHGELWAGYGPAAFQGSLSWEADNRTLQVLGSTPNLAEFRILLVNTAKTGSDLVADSRVAANIPGTIAHGTEPSVQWRDVTITPDGRTVILSLEIAPPQIAQVSERLERVEVLPGKVTQVLNARKQFSAYEQILWTGVTGRALIVTGNGPRGGGAGIYVGTRYTAIPWRASNLTAAW